MISYARYWTAIRMNHKRKSLSDITEKLRVRDSYPEKAIAAYLLLTARVQGVKFTDASLQGIGCAKSFWDSVMKELSDKDIDTSLWDESNNPFLTNWDSFLNSDKKKYSTALDFLKRIFPK